MKLLLPFAVALVAVLGCAHAQVAQVKLDYSLASLEPVIDAKTMNLHFGTHYAGYVKNLNAATAKAANPSVKSADLTTLVKNVKSYSGDLATAVRNQGGGAWNHALYFKHLAAPGSPAADPAVSLSAPLSAAIDASFGSFDKMKAELTTASTKVFGSGWAWLCYTGEKLVVTSTPNQDNPLMGSLPNTAPVKAAGCTPILGVDVWEHAYYLKHGPKRAAYIDDLLNKAINWSVVSDNFAAAKAGKVATLVA